MDSFRKDISAVIKSMQNDGQNEQTWDEYAKANPKSTLVPFKRKYAPV
jgi:hypothetical protein